MEISPDRSEKGSGRIEACIDRTKAGHDRVVARPDKIEVKTNSGRIEAKEIPGSMMEVGANPGSMAVGANCGSMTVGANSGSMEENFCCGKVFLLHILIGVS